MTSRPVTMAKLYAAERDRWPGYAAWVVDQARRRGGTVAADHVVLPADLFEQLRAESAARVGAIPPRPMLQPLTPARAVTGAVGLARALTGTGGASAEQVAARLAVCGSCPDRVTTLGVDRCRLCSCVLAAKARNADQQCPAGRWPG